MRPHRLANLAHQLPLWTELGGRSFSLIKRPHVHLFETVAFTKRTVDRLVLEGHDDVMGIVQRVLRADSKQRASGDGGFGVDGFSELLRVLFVAI